MLPNTRLSLNPTLRVLSYNSIISSLFNQFGLAIKHNRSGVFHFSRSKNIIDPSPLDLRSAGSAILRSKDTWQYLEFFFDIKLSFQQHICYYANKALSTIKGIKMLSNSTRGLSLIYEYLLYRTYVFLIALYGFQL